ncbi:hypothetical protein ABVF61_30765 [Roseibium sp. HPY-6]|uniref:hypothetical protein n=1 Tax=Roseibium sp. HPY-6 TaxID=3229852 RepID=UPI00338EC839
MLDEPKSLPSDPAELRVTAEGLAELTKAQALKIAKLEDQLSVHRRYCSDATSATADQLALEHRLEEEETAAAQITPPDSEGIAEKKAKPLPPKTATLRRSAVAGSGMHLWGVSLAKLTRM